MTKPIDCDASLDPSDWEGFRRLAHAALDDAVDFMRTVRERPVWQPVPESTKMELAEPLPLQPQGIEMVYREFLRLVLPYSVGNTHPLFFGWVHGAGLASALVPAMMDAAMNANCGGRDHIGLYVERVVVDWCKSIFQFPGDAAGILVTGTSMANLIGLAVARNAHTSGEIQLGGLKKHPRQLMAYTSDEAHESISKAIEILGVGREGLRRIRVNQNFQMNLDALRGAIREDRKAGLEPFCVIGTAGTVNSGSIDDLQSLATICREQRLWFHVDGAFGALGVLSEEIRPHLAGMELADSLAFDFHKWMHVQYDAGCVLVRDGRQQQKTFSLRPEYLRRGGRGLSGGGVWPCDLGPELSRGFRALKVWFALKEHGVHSFARAITANCRQAQYLAELVRHTPDLELMNSPSLSIVCFRFRPPGWASPEIDTLTENIVADLQESGIAAPSTTRINGALSIRVNITNHRTRETDLDCLIHAVCDFAKKRVEST